MVMAERHSTAMPAVDATPVWAWDGRGVTAGLCAFSTRARVRLAAMSRSRPSWRVLLAWAPALAIMVVIFLASAEHHPVLVSDPTADVVLKKLGHFTGYALLGASLVLALAVTIGRSRAGDADEGTVGWSAAALERRTLAGAWAIAATYACSDEFHQVFVSGRTPSIVDVGIDSLGALTGIAILAWWLRRRRGI